MFYHGGIRARAGSKDTRPPIPATKDRPRRVDYEYERAGVVSVFMFTELLAGWRDERVDSEN